MNEFVIPASVLAALAEGSVRQANVMLGFEYFINGKVVHGNHLGRTIGFPTANLHLDKGSPLLLGHGVYLVHIGQKEMFYRGIANIGLRPTIDGKKVTVEVNIFDFAGDLYGHHLTVWFLDRIREEKKFATLDDLASQIRRDKKTALALFSRRS